MDPVIKRNGVFAQPENLIKRMTEDPRKYVRELDLRRIIKEEKRMKREKKYSNIHGSRIYCLQKLQIIFPTSFKRC